MSVLCSRALRFRTLLALRSDFLDLLKRRRVLLSFVRRQRRAWRDVVVIVLMGDDPMPLRLLKPDGLPLALRYKFEDEDGELSLDDFFFRAIAVPSVRVAVRVCGVVPAAAVGPSEGARALHRPPRTRCAAH